MPDARLGRGTQIAYDLIRSRVPFVEADTVLYPYMNAVRELVAGESCVRWPYRRNSGLFAPHSIASPCLPLGTISLTKALPRLNSMPRAVFAFDISKRQRAGVRNFAFLQ